MPFLILVICFALATAFIARGKDQSFVLWFFIGGLAPGLGLIAIILSRREQVEPERRCPNCGKVLKLYVQVCTRCGTDLYLPDPSEVRQGPDVRATQAH
jgi:hypothetical protein